MKYLFLITILSLASSCQKEDMPYDGHKNIFRCKVNGVEWTPHCISDFFGCSAVDCQYYVTVGALEISALRKFQDNSVNEFIGLDKNSIKIGENELEQSSGYEFANVLKPSPCGYYDMDESLIHRITIIRIDSIKHIVEGTFEFTAYDRNNLCVDTVHITDGYFDLEYRF